MGEISFSHIMDYAQLSSDAYLSLDEIREKYDSKLIASGEEGDNDIRFFMIEKDKQIYLSFRGTADFENALTDAEYAMHFDKDLGVYIHTGFQDAYHNVEQAIDEKINGIIQTKTPLNITGHSLGGALAAVAYMHLKLRGAVLNSVITFGQPKVTGPKGLDKYSDSPLIRVVDEKDPVPLLPPTTLLSEIHGGYKHFGKELLLLDGEYYSLLEERQADESKVSSFWRNLTHQKLSDHYIANYIKRIQSKLEESEEVPYSSHRKYEDKAKYQEK